MPSRPAGPEGGLHFSALVNLCPVHRHPSGVRAAAQGWGAGGGGCFSHLHRGSFSPPPERRPRPFRPPRGRLGCPQGPGECGWLGPRGKASAGCRTPRGAEGGVLHPAARDHLRPRGRAGGSQRGGLPDLLPGSRSATPATSTRAPWQFPPCPGPRSAWSCRLSRSSSVSSWRSAPRPPPGSGKPRGSYRT